jgi:nucleoside-diphosphate-sugar epimerase
MHTPTDARASPVICCCLVARGRDQVTHLQDACAYCTYLGYILNAHANARACFDGKTSSSKKRAQSLVVRRSRCWIRQAGFLYEPEHARRRATNLNARTRIHKMGKGASRGPRAALLLLLVSAVNAFSPLPFRWIPSAAVTRGLDVRGGGQRVETLEVQHQAFGAPNVILWTRKGDVAGWSARKRAPSLRTCSVKSVSHSQMWSLAFGWVTRREFAAGLVTAAFIFRGSPSWDSETSAGSDISGVLGGHVAVLGASGRTGGEIVKYCVATGRAVRACTRSGEFDAAALLGAASPLVTSVSADVTKPETLPDAVAGVDTVIFAATAPAFGSPREVDLVGLESTARACIANSVTRFVLISGAGVTKLKSPAYRFLNRFGCRMDAKLAGESAVRALYATAPPGITYTIVRPSGLRDADWAARLPARGPAALEINQGDEVAGSISRADLAAVAVECAAMNAAAGATFEVYDVGSQLATRSLSISGILSDPTAQAVARFVTRERGQAPVPVTGCERRGADYATLFSGLKGD